MLAQGIHVSLNLSGRVPPTIIFGKFSAISGLSGYRGVKILIPEILEAKYSFFWG
jgi:hypothetical protein